MGSARSKIVEVGLGGGAGLQTDTAMRNGPTTFGTLPRILRQRREAGVQLRIMIEARGHFFKAPCLVEPLLGCPVIPSRMI
jgi:hypothetical protein